MVDRKMSPMVAGVRGLLLCCSICAALFPSVIKIYETSWQFREAADPSVYDNWRDYFESKPVILNAEMTGLSDKNLMRIHLFIVPYFVAAGIMFMVYLLPKAQSTVFGGRTWMVFRAFCRRSIHCPQILQVVLPASITFGEALGVVVFLCMNWGIFAARVERSLFRGSRKLTFLVDSDKTASKEPLSPHSWQACEVWALTIGIMAVINMGWYLFLPIGKRSVFLDIFGLSWDSAIKYHRWIGYYTCWLSIVHGAMYLAIFYAKNGDSNFDPSSVLVKHNLNAWGCTGEGECDEEQQLMLRRNMYGITAITLLLLMVLCSLAYVRRHFFNTFYAMHHLVFVILLFLCLHYKGTIILIIPGLAVYLIDKLLGLLAWANSVDATAKTVSPGVLEVAIPLSSNACYAAGQYIQVNVPAASALEWHPFSITSGPHEWGGRQLTFHIKGLGDWTNKVMEAVHDGTVRVRVDGFYGHDMAAPLLHKSSVVLVGGGIGITPMMSVCSDLLHRGFAKVHLLWVVRSVEEFNIFGAQLGAAAEAYPHQLSVKVWITLRGHADKHAVTADTITQQLPVFHSKDSSLLRATPPVTPNRWMMPPAAQAFVTMLAILTSTAAFGLSQWVGSEQNEWKPDSQRVFDLFLVIISLLSVALVSVLAMIVAPLLLPRKALPSTSASTSGELPPTNTAAASILHVATSADTAPDNFPVMLHGAAFGSLDYLTPHLPNSAPIALQPYPPSYSVPHTFYPQLGPWMYPGGIASSVPGVQPAPPVPPQAQDGTRGMQAPAGANVAAPHRAAVGSLVNGRIGKRPDIAAEFEAIAAAADPPLAPPGHEGPVDIGVLACGPQQLVGMVSAACNDRSWAMINQSYYDFTVEDWDW